MPWDGRRSTLTGYSGGGAAALAFAAKHPDRLLSLALLEPAWAGNWDWSPAYAELRKKYDRAGNLPPEQFLPAFVRLGVKPDVVLPPSAGSLAFVDGQPACGHQGVPADLQEL